MAYISFGIQIFRFCWNNLYDNASFKTATKLHVFAVATYIKIAFGSFCTENSNFSYDLFFFS